MTLVVAIIWAAGTRTISTGRAHVRRTGRASASIDLRALWRVLRQTSVIVITLSYAAYGYFQYLFFYWISYYFETIQHEDRIVSRGYTTAITLAMGAGMLCGGWLTSRVPASFSPWARRGAGARRWECSPAAASSSSACWLQPAGHDRGFCRVGRISRACARPRSGRRRSSLAAVTAARPRA